MTTPHYQDSSITLWHGDCLEVMRELPDSSVDSVVTDPPYGLGFMGKAWDDLPPGLPFAQECLRVLKPGGHMLAFGGSRTWHRLAVAVEDAGFEIRDSIAWLYGSGFPKSLDVSKAIDKAAGATRATKSVASAASAYSANAGNHRPWMDNEGTVEVAGDTPATAEAEQWEGWGTALKPAFEPIVVGRKPLTGTVAANVLKHGTGALNIAATRVGDESRSNPAAGNKAGGASLNMSVVGMPTDADPTLADGRWPTNVVLDESQATELDKQAPATGGAGRASGPSLREKTESSVAFGARNGFDGEPAFYGDKGGASRFFPTFRYEAKAPTHERPRNGEVAHPTVKPLELMQWLVKLVTPPGGTVLEPFAGSGTTAEACVIEHFKCIAIEREVAYLSLIVQRLSKPIQVGLDFGESA